MLTAARAFAQAGGRPLPRVAALADLYELGIEFYRGEMVLIAGRPNDGKTPLMQFITAQLAKQHDQLVWYIAADQSKRTTSSRNAAIVTGDKVAWVREAMAEGGLAADYYMDALMGLKIQYSFQADPSMDDLIEELYALIELWDAFPDVIVIDNLQNVGTEMGEGYHAWMNAMNSFQSLCRLTGATVFVLHHVTEGSSVPQGTPQPRGDIQGKVSQRPEWVFTVAYEPVSQEFRIAPVKGRDLERVDTSGKTWVALRSDPSRIAFYRNVPTVTYAGEAM